VVEWTVVEWTVVERDADELILVVTLVVPVVVEERVVGRLVRVVDLVVELRLNGITGPGAGNVLSLAPRTGNAKPGAVGTAAGG
jgi:hypothetical protein